jgi:hypothetical protein
MHITGAYWTDEGIFFVLAQSENNKQMLSFFCLANSLKPAFCF